MEINNDATLIILDWDDTLFPTTWIHKNNINIFNNKENLYNNYFKTHDILLYKLFTNLIKCGTVIIITNALLNWIDISLSLLPKLTHLFKIINIKIKSARSDYSHITKDPYIWKKLAFKNELKKIEENKYINNVISLGDAEYEYYALINLCEYGKNIQNYKLLKSLKFIRYSSILEIYKQLDVANRCILNICKNKTHLDLELKPIHK